MLRRWLCAVCLLACVQFNPTVSGQHELRPEYSPCIIAGYNPNDPQPFKVECPASLAHLALEAFQRNVPNTNICSLHVQPLYDWTEDTIHQIFVMVAQGSAETVREIRIQSASASISRVPDSINMFQSLESLTIRSWASLATLPRGFLVKTSLPSLRGLDLAFNGISSFQPESLQGDFSQVEIRLRNNDLHHLDAQFFQPLLQSMVDGEGKVVISNGGDVMCDCSSSWLIQDDRLVAHLNDPVCSDSLTGQIVDIGLWTRTQCSSGSRLILSHCLLVLFLSPLFWPIHV